MFMYPYSFSYFYILIPAMILAVYAQSKVGSTFNKYSRVSNSRGFTGAEVARQLLSAAGIHDVTVERVGGNLTDHYDPRTKTLRLSDSVYGSTSIAAIGVAAHETGHAIQHDEGYVFLKLRSAMVPVTNIGSNLAMPLIVIGVLIGGMAGSSFGYTIIQFGIVLFSLAVAFSLITLPVEFDASKRAIETLGMYNFLSDDELKPAKKVLSAAALTYVASAAVAISNLLRLVLMFGRRND